MNVERIMKREVKVCSTSDTLNRAAQLMWENDCGSVPVVEGDGMVVGMLTDRDICMAAYTQGTNLHVVQAANAMSRDLVACRPGDDLAKAEEIMRAHRVRRLPVVDGDHQLVGIVSLSDLARVASEPAEKSEVADTLAAVSAPREQIPVETPTKGRRAASSKRSVSRPRPAKR